MPHFFKYVTANTGRRIIKSRRLRWTTPAMLNDPIDMQFAFQLRIDRQAARAMALDKLWQHYYGELLDQSLNEFGRQIRQNRQYFPQMSREEFDQEVGQGIDASIDEMTEKIGRFSEMIKDHFGNDKILCLSEIPDSILMWSYYAQNHTGIVLRFTDETPDNQLTRARLVNYVEQMPSLFDDDRISNMLAGYSGMDTRRIMDEITLTKSNHWAHERERRVYSGRGRTSGSYEDVPFGYKELDGVIFGARISKADRATLADLVRTFYPHVKLLQAKARTDAYGLSIDSAEIPNARHALYGATLKQWFERSETIMALIGILIIDKVRRLLVSLLQLRRP